MTSDYSVSTTAAARVRISLKHKLQRYYHHHHLDRSRSVFARAQTSCYHHNKSIDCKSITNNTSTGVILLLFYFRSPPHAHCKKNTYIVFVRFREYNTHEKKLKNKLNKLRTIVTIAFIARVDYKLPFRIKSSSSSYTRIEHE